MRLVECLVETDDVDGFVGDLGAIGDRHGATVQAFDARYVVGRAHLERALACADRARERGEGIARERGVEVLLYAAGRRQIDRALTMGIGAGRTPAVVLVDGGDEAAAADAVRALPATEPASTLGEYDPDRVREFFGVSDAELAAADGDLAALVGERVALLAVDR
ncbi:MAG: KEOPS complex subunit Cgi121 [Haloferacaceae archaeon]